MECKMCTVFFSAFCASVLIAPSFQQAEVVYQWNIIEYEWPNDTVKQQGIADGTYIPENSAVNGIKVYKGKVYVTVPRLKPGVPSTLNVIVKSSTATNPTSMDYVLRPFPNWDMQEVGNCEALQGVQSMEIDPHTGYMWIVDTGGRPGTFNVTVQPVDTCPPKIVIYDINNMKEVHRYDFPKSVTGIGLFYLNDIVLGFDAGKARYAFISDTLAYKLVVYDYKENTSFSYSHATMAADEDYMNITIGNITLTGIITGINGIAMSSDYMYLYYSAVAGVGLHQVETSVVTSAKGDNSQFADAVRTIGEKTSQGDGMVYSENHNLYYSALGPNAIYKWEVSKDINSAGEFDKVQLISHAEHVSDVKMEWVDTLAIDEDGNLWYTTSRLNKFFSQGGVQQTEPNFFVWRMYIGERSYMATTGPTLGASTTACSISGMVFCFLLALFILN